MYYDISLPIRPAMPRFPGDPEVEVHPLSVAGPGTYGVSALSLGSHTGTHLDPPGHFVPGGAAVDRLDLDALNGPCTVVEVPTTRRFIGSADLPAAARSDERLLFRTGNSERWAAGSDYFPDYVALTGEAARALLDRRPRLVGIDALSVENDPTGRYPVHRALLGAGIPILEGLVLAGVPPGEYELVCAPLRLADGDGAPTRAFLRRA